MKKNVNESLDDYVEMVNLIKKFEIVKQNHSVTCSNREVDQRVIWSNFTIEDNSISFGIVCDGKDRKWSVVIHSYNTKTLDDVKRFLSRLNYFPSSNGFLETQYETEDKHEALLIWTHLVDEYK